MNMEALIELKPNLNIPSFDTGDTVKVSTRVVEGERVRTQIFQGVVIRIRNSGAGSSFTVRRVTYGVGVERTFPIYSPNVEKVEVARRGKTRRAKLYYMRGLSAKASRIKERRLTPQEMERENEEARNLAEQRAQLEREKALTAEQDEQPETEETEAPTAEQDEQPKD